MDPCRFPLDIRHGTTLTLPPASDIWWASLETCSNLLPWGPLSPPHPLVLTSGSRCSYCWQAGGTHPIGMLSCITYFYRAGGGGPAWSLAPQPRGLSNVVMKTEPLSPKHLNFLQDTARRSSIKSQRCKRSSQEDSFWLHRRQINSQAAVSGLEKLTILQTLRPRLHILLTSLFLALRPNSTTGVHWTQFLNGTKTVTLMYGYR